MKHIILTLVFVLTTSVAYAAGDTPKFDKQYWSFDGITGTYDREQLQKGFQVYREVCAACHSMDRIHYRNLSALGYSPEQIKAVASEYTVTDGPNDEGDMFERPAILADPFKNPFDNDKAARYANNGAHPPDLSLIVKARKDGANYVYALLTGYSEPKHGVELGPNMHYNEVYPGHQIAMAQPISDGQVFWSDGNEATVEEAAYAVTNFLAWASRPELEARKRMGIQVVLFLIVFAGIMYKVKRKIWADVKGK